MNGTDFTSLHFSTRELAPGKRLQALRELFNRAVRLNIDTEPGRAVEMQMHVAPGLRRATMLSPLTAHLTRPAPMLADGEDTICLMMKTSGHMALAQGRREGVPAIGDGVLLVYREPVELHFVDTTYLSVRVPFTALAGLANVEAAAARCIPATTEALSLLRGYVAGLPDRFADPQLARLCATHVYDLIALAIGATEEGREIACQRGVRAARLQAIKADLVRDAALHIDELAARQGISPRYVQMLFEEAGTTFSDFAVEQRLDAARTMLTSPRYASWSVTELAFEAGFGDLSHFNRRFKRRFLMTPSEMRRNGKAEATADPDLSNGFQN
ncbi:AraC family transcriptional regulator [Mesorhizobium sp.]|uniref:helix-turn-helix domain-containing protein n=1 Tax=Mesorhizobium sp. TaxID=1871066 RepID=UPI00120BC397|nr:AraC family transcriptional regulator [Mesorhizobium sp.]TIT00021.1 MAG: helix-turn-helix domain-containing protein [Mesorhizobium sp.]